MIRISALNEESSEEYEEEDVPTITKEAQEELSLARYKSSLELIRDEKYEDAEKILLELLGTKLLQEVEKPTGAVQVPASLSLKYSCLKNLGSLALKKDNNVKALEFFLQAADLDDSDVSLWFKTGCVAEKVDKFNLAASSFVEGLRCSPNHWPCLDHLVTILFAADDYLSCLFYVARGLKRDPEYAKGLVLRDEMLRESPFLKDTYKDMHSTEPLSLEGTADEEITHEILEEAKEVRRRWFQSEKPRVRPTLGLSRPLKFTWLSLGEELLQLYNFIQFTDAPYGLCDRIDFKSVRADSTYTASPVKVVEPQIQNEHEEQNNNEGSGEGEGCKSKASAGGKRRMFLESWVLGGQRRSARVRSTAKRDTDDVSLGETLRRLIPLSLLPEKEGIRSSEDSMDTMDMFKFLERQQGDPASIAVRRPSANNQADIEENIKKQEYFATEKEKKDLEDFVSENEKNGGVTSLLFNFIQGLSRHRELTWPQKLISVYVDCYALMRKSSPHPNPLLTDESTTEDFKSDGEISLLHSELFMDRVSPPKRGSNESDEIPLKVCEDISHLIFLTCREELFKDDFLLRVYWLRAHVALQRNNPQESLVCLNEVLDILVLFPDGVLIPNCYKNGLVTVEIVEKLKSSLENSQNLASIQQLWSENKWEELVLVLESSFQNQNDQNQQLLEEDLCRCTQLGMFLDALLNLEDQFPRSFFWIEALLNESFNKYLSVSEEEEVQKKWSKAIEKMLWGLIYCVEEYEIKIFGSLPCQRLARLIQNLCHIICHQLDTPESQIEMPIETVDPWILLHLILSYEEEKNEKEDAMASTTSSEDGDKSKYEIPGSLMIFFTAHEHLGKRSWCCLNEGALLLYAMDAIVPRLRSETYAPFRNKLTPYLEQMSYCLYAYPNKKTKSKYLQEHSVPQITLSFERSQQLLELYRPDELPEFDRNATITADSAQLFKRILGLVPNECDPGDLPQKIKQFISGTLTDLPKSTHEALPPGVRDINFLLADHYFKISDWSLAIQFLLQDLCHNPDRFDSWACMALARGSQLDTELNSCEPIDEIVFVKRANATKRCYQRALELDRFRGMLWIEYGSFVYAIHSFCSRLLKQDSDKLSLEQFEMLEETKESMLNTAEECFKTASQLWNDLGEESGQQDERWLHHYMLGKIMEKRESEPMEAVSHYQKAATCLYENEATYPSKINYTNPAEYTVETLEVHYRIHACILKFLESNEGKSIDEKYQKFISEVLESESKGPFMTQQGKNYRKRKSSTESTSNEAKKTRQSDTSNEVKAVVEQLVTKTSAQKRRSSQESTTTTSASTSSSTSSSSDSSSSSSSSSSDTTEEDSSDHEIKKTDNQTNILDYDGQVSLCLKALETCILRFPEHYKALFRLAHYYFRSKTHRNVDKCRELMLGPELSANSNATTTTPHGLFQDRKPSNFFNGVWRIPVNEIDRPGCFASHMSRCVLLMMDLVRELRDHATLLDLCLQLKRTPDPDKKYLRDCEREQLSRQALVLSIQALRSKFKEMKPGDEKLPALMVDTLRSLHKVQRHLQTKEQPFNKLITDCFAMYTYGKLETEVSVLEPALKFAQQELSRLKAQDKAQVPSSSGGTPLASPAVLTPTTLAPAFVPTRKERGSGSSRRGRPPLSRTNSPRAANFSPNLSTSGSSGRGRPRGRSVTHNPFTFPTPNIFSDPSYLTAAVQAQIPSLDAAYNYFNLKAQMEAGMQAQFFHHMLASQSQSGGFPSFNPAAALSQLSSSFNTGLGQFPLPNPPNPTVQQISKDRPNLSVIAVNPNPPIKLSVPTKAKLKAKVPTPPMRASPVPPQPIKKQKTSFTSATITSVTKPSPVSVLTGKSSPISITATGKSSPIPGVSRKASPIPNMARVGSPVTGKSSPILNVARTASPVQGTSSPMGRKQSPTSLTIRKHSPIPSMSRQQSPIPGARKNSPTPHMSRKQSPIPSMSRQQSPIPGGRTQSPSSLTIRKHSPIPTMSRQQSPIPGGRTQSPSSLTIRKQSPIPSMSRQQLPMHPMARKQPSLMGSRKPIPSAMSRKPTPNPLLSRNPSPFSSSHLVPRGPPRPHVPSTNPYVSPPQAHMNPSLQRIGREVTVTASAPKKTTPLPHPKPVKLPLNLPSSITVTTTSTVPRPTQEEISIQRVPPAKDQQQPKAGSGPEIITLE